MNKDGKEVKFPVEGGKTHFWVKNKKLEKVTKEQIEGNYDHEYSTEVGIILCDRIWMEHGKRIQILDIKQV